MIKKIDHIGIVVRDIDKAVKIYVDKLGLKLLRTEVSDVYNVKIAFIPCGEVLIELLQPIGPGMNQDFLNETGGGIHHIAYVVDDVEECFTTMKKELKVKEEGIKPGAGRSRIFFLDPSVVDNVETEFMELAK